MRRLTRRALAMCALVLPLSAANAQAPAWNATRARELAERATARRALQLADTGLRDYSALAHGFVTFLAQVGEGLTEPPKIVKADELVSEIYWLAPNRSKQRIVGRRDTLLLPTDISYHRDHLGIVQNNFPSIIRLGDGDEVRDVPHPLSTEGLEAYDFAITDSLDLQLPGRRIQVLEVKVRPRDDRAARVIGALYIDREEAQVVRMAFTFTRAAFLDDALEDLSVVIENSLVSGRFWLPRRQEIEIQRGGSWLDYPIRGIIRGRWEIGDYKVNTGLQPGFFGGQEIVLAPRAVSDTFHFAGKVLDSLPPDVRAVSDADVRQVREEARALVRAQALARPQALIPAANGISDVAHVNRVEGLALGAGVTSRVHGVGLQARGRYGIDDREGKGFVGLDYRRPRAAVRVSARRDFREAGDIVERSGVVNSLAAQEFGADDTDPYGVQSVGTGLDLLGRRGFNLHLDVTLERQRPLSVHATPAFGSYEPTIPAAKLRTVRGALRVDRPTTLSWFGTEVRLDGELRVARISTDDQAVPVADGVLTRAFAAAAIERPTGAGRLVALVAGGGVHGGARVPMQDLVYLGGPVSAAGYGYHQLAGDAAVMASMEWRVAAPGPSLNLGRFGKVPGTLTLAPLVQAAWIHAHSAPSALGSGVYPSVGIAVLPLFDLVRLQVARGLHKGRWTFNVDISRDFWGIL